MLVIDHCYHGTVDEAFATLGARLTVSRTPKHRSAGAVTKTTTSSPFNDVAALEPQPRDR